MSSPIVRRYKAALTKLGLPPEVSESGDDVAFGFEHEGTRYALSINLGDPKFLMLMTIYGLGAEGLDEATAAIRARDVNAVLKGVKVTPVTEDALVLFSVEQFLENSPPGPEILARAMSVLKLASHEFFKGMSPAAILKVSRRSATLRRRKPRKD